MTPPRYAFIPPPPGPPLPPPPPFGLYFGTLSYAFGLGFLSDLFFFLLPSFLPRPCPWSQSCPSCLCPPVPLLGLAPPLPPESESESEDEEEEEDSSLDSSTPLGRW